MKLAVIGKSPFVAQGPASTTLDLFTATGFNTGNLAFALAAHKIMAGDKTYFDWTFDPAAIDRAFDAAVLVCANMINPDLDLSGLAERLDALTLPLCVFSIGCQGPLDCTEFALQPGTLRFLQVVARKCRSFGIRGATSARFLISLGIDNWQIVGCPSNFLGGVSDARWQMEQRIRRTGPVLLHVDMVADLAALLATFRSLTADVACQYMVQSPYLLVDLARTSTADQLDAAKLWVMQAFGIGDAGASLAFIRDALRVFFSMEEWSAYTTRFDFSLGARLHGNIVAMRCGVPCLVVAHDERTRELSETLALPYLVLDEFLALGSLADARAFVASRLDAYWARCAVLAERFVALLRDNGISVAPTYVAETVPIAR